jgi:hypothetical protein
MKGRDYSEDLCLGGEKLILQKIEWGDGMSLCAYGQGQTVDS